MMIGKILKLLLDQVKQVWSKTENNSFFFGLIAGANSWKVDSDELLYAFYFLYPANGLFRVYVAYTVSNKMSIKTLTACCWPSWTVKIKFYLNKTHSPEIKLFFLRLCARSTCTTDWAVFLLLFYVGIMYFIRSSGFWVFDFFSCPQKYGG